MTSAIKKLIEDIDQLAIWLHDNPNVPMPSQYKQKAQVVLQKIINADSLSEQEWEKFKPLIQKPALAPIPKKKAKPQKQNPPKTQNSSKKNASSKKKKKKSRIPRAHIVRGGLPGLGKR